MKSKKIAYLVIIMPLWSGSTTAYGKYHAPSLSAKLLKPLAVELKSLTKDILVSPLAFGFVSHTLCGKNFYKPCLVHFFVRPRLQDIIGLRDHYVAMRPEEEALRYGIGATASSIAPVQIAALYVTYRVLSKLIKVSGKYLYDWFNQNNDWDINYTNHYDTVYILRHRLSKDVD